MMASNAMLFGPKRQAAAGSNFTQCAEVRVAHFDTSGLEDAAAELVTQGIDVVRVGYSDLIGTERGRDVLVNRFARTVEDGVAFCRSVYGTTRWAMSSISRAGWMLGCPTCLPSPTSARFTWCRGSPASRTSLPMYTTRMARLRRKVHAWC